MPRRTARRPGQPQHETGARPAGNFSRISIMTTPTRDLRPDAPNPATRRVPERPALEGLEERWIERWRSERTYAFVRPETRAEVYSIDTPPPTVSGSLHVGHVFSFTHTDMIAR
jgi:valyl-tRNA synthetase